MGGAIAIAYASATECYVCNSIITPGCEKKQEEKSNSFDCASQTPLTGKDYVCGKLTYEFQDVGDKHVERSCIESTNSCEAMKKQFKEHGILLKECDICADDKCNGQ
nr:unnamed protein product [Callosobruchus chinensis]